MPGVIIWGYDPATDKHIRVKVDAEGVVQVCDPKVGSLISYDGTTTADGNPAGTTLVCAGLTTKPDYNGNLVIITSGAYAGQARNINGVTTGGTVTPASAFGGQIVSGTEFVIVGIRTTPAEVAKMIFSMDFWSDPAEEVQVGDAAAGATVALPTVTVADLPPNATIVRAIAMFKFRMVENTNAAANKLNGATVATTSQVIQVDDSGATGYVDAINFVDDQFGLAAETREGGDVLIGSIDIATRVDGNDTYSVRWLLARADLDYLNFNDVQCGLRIWYSV